MTIDRLLAPHSLDAPLMTFDLATMIAEMKAEPTWEASSRNAITLLKDHGLRVVLVVMRAGTFIASHRAQGPITIQVLEGRVSLTVGAHEVVLGSGRFLSLGAGAAHDVRAIEESAFLLTVGAEDLHPAEGREP
jgi:quercetin dioxygenase-like cupin family protein